LPAGTLLPTARAFQLFSKVAVNGENVLAAKAIGNTTDVRVYAATNHGGVQSLPLTLTLDPWSMNVVIIE
jgi:hypothetical protein